MPARIITGTPTAATAGRLKSKPWNAARLALVGRSIEPDENESSGNPRSRSARLRVAVRLDRGIAA